MRLAWPRKRSATKGTMSPKKLLRLAEAEGTKGDVDKTLKLFESSIQSYLKTGSTLKAIGAVKSAKTMLGAIPKVEALLIRLYNAMGLAGDAEREFHESASLTQKEKIPLFKGLQQNEFVEFLEIMNIAEIKKGELAIKQGDKGDEIYGIIEGCFDVIRDGKKIGIMREGDIFGEIGFFHHATRSASIKSQGKGKLIEIHGEPLRTLCKKYPNVHHTLESLYIERILKKAKKDLSLDPDLDLKGDISHIHFSKGQEIFLDYTKFVIIVSHGVAEINYDEKGLKKKRFIGPGNVFSAPIDRATANTDVEIIQAKINR